MSHEDIAILKDYFRDLLVQHRESTTVLTSGFVRDVQDSQRRNEILFIEIKEEISKLKDEVVCLKGITENTPIVNKSVFAFIGLVVFGFLSAIGAIVWNKMSAGLLLVKIVMKWF